MMSSLSQTKGFIAVNIRLFMDSSVKREWSFFLFWALNPCSQGTMPTGMICVCIKCEHIDYLEAKGVSEASQFPRHDAWINLSIDDLIHNSMNQTWPLTMKKCHHSLDYWIIVPRIMVNHHSSKFTAYGILWKQRENQSPSISVTQFCLVSTTSHTNFVWVTIRALHILWMYSHTLA